MGRGVNAPHRRSDAQDDLEGVSHVSMDYGFLGEGESEEHVSPVLVMRERRHKMTWVMLVPRKRNGVLLDRKESSEGHRHAQVRQRAGDRGIGERNRTSSRKPVQWDHRACSGTRGRPGQNTECFAEASHRNQNPT